MAAKSVDGRITAEAQRGEAATKSEKRNQPQRRGERREKGIGISSRLANDLDYCSAEKTKTYSLENLVQIASFSQIYVTAGVTRRKDL